MQKKWLISYILETPGLEHVNFFDALKSIDAERIMSSHWVFRSDKTASELRDRFASLLAPSDHVLVAELGQDIVWGTGTK